MDSKTSQERSDEFLKISDQFKLGVLVTESSHPVTSNLSEVAKDDVPAALKLLFDVDDDVIRTFKQFVSSGKAAQIKEVIINALMKKGRIFFTGCGSTGRLSILLDSIWRDFFSGNAEYEDRTFSVMAGGDYALIKSVEGFEDFTAFGKKQMTDLNVSSDDVVFAITEGGETSFVIGTAWAGLEAGAKVYFVYNNPDDILVENVERSRQIIQDDRIEKINLTTGPMAITGSTRMQATSIQLCVMLTVLEMVVRKLTNHSDDSDVPKMFLDHIQSAHQGLKSAKFLQSLAELVVLEETIYREGSKNNYLAGRFGIDVLTDTTERSPTYCTPPFRKFDDDRATESWAFLFLPQEDSTEKAWRSILKREPRCVEWPEKDVRALVTQEAVQRTLETVDRIRKPELMRYKIDAGGMQYRALKSKDCIVAVISQNDSKETIEHLMNKLVCYLLYLNLECLIILIYYHF